MPAICFRTIELSKFFKTSGVSWTGSVVIVTKLSDFGSFGSRSAIVWVIFGQTVGQRVKMMFESHGFPPSSSRVNVSPIWLVKVKF